MGPEIKAEQNNATHYTSHVSSVPGAEVFYPLNSAEIVPEDLLCDRNVLESVFEEAKL